ncbi:CrcB [Desulforapulum autotrophicum HRM2]|uniref:Fluoride-specific ion channel FluC n=1 Tax=Desulforapulum autotrophicum (strain ATCC 43914 / DSM 3382 / VKM B-1955 / HRM2) TaxID=177437 RepID=FLUC_DESAH|nr:CrcB family protein [Desulforapulum autotrophicum]C0QDP8.1 RecName: Full=Fluoride-specific ion channel FluC [Desulforapulum autotrophicum HRM2]ACN17319.1 CrcB [Desulforapulum autotrophicum HRM2]
MEHKFVFIALAGALGTLARYSLAGFVQQFNSSFFPFGTLVVNITGCFAAGFLWTLFESRWAVSGEVRTFVLVGFMGAFTTFSAFILETGMLVRSTEWIYGIVNLLLQNSLGFGALMAGIVLGRLI